MSTIIEHAPRQDHLRVGAFFLAALKPGGHLAGHPGVEPRGERRWRAAARRSGLHGTIAKPSERACSRSAGFTAGRQDAACREMLPGTCQHGPGDLGVRADRGSVHGEMGAPGVEGSAALD